jgi:hypothetical protein
VDKKLKTLINRVRDSTPRKIKIFNESKMEESGDEWDCLYEEIFSLTHPKEDIRKTIDVIFQPIFAFCMRHYRSEYSRQDLINAKLVHDRSNHALKLVYILLMLTQERSIREHVITDVSRESLLSGRCPDRVRKAIMFYRVMSGAARSLIEFPYDETNAAMAVGSFLGICTIAWLCMDSLAMSMFCDSFGARCEGDLCRDDGGMFRSDELTPRLWMAEDIRTDRGLPNDPSPTLVEEVVASGIVRPPTGGERMRAAVAAIDV